MKTKSKFSAYILCGTTTALLVSCVIVALCLAINLPEQPAKTIAPQNNTAFGANRTLSFADRVAYQTAIEDVYWRHRIWPNTNPGPKPALDKVMSQADIEKKVTDYLRNSQALEDYWQRSARNASHNDAGGPLTADQLQAEMERMASHTKQPEVLQELFDALGNDPFVIAECLARPVLTERVLTELTQGRDGSPSRPFLSALQSARPAVAPYQPTYTLPVIASPTGGCIDDTWTPTTTLANAPEARDSHTAVWTGSEMIIWGGTHFNVVLNTGARYSPSTDSWTAISTTNAPFARWFPYNCLGSVWTGSEMIVWGGLYGTGLSNGGRYNPSTDSWGATSTINAPEARWNYTPVWTGSEMIVWGGAGSVSVLNTGGRYNPVTDSWTATSIINAPSPRNAHTAVWNDSGHEMIVWGGSAPTNTGGRYNPSTDSWTATSTTNAPSARYNHTAVWSGSQMIVWGGRSVSTYFNTGGHYDPVTDSWTAACMTNAPSPRELHKAVWTGSEMIVWGGGNDGGLLNSGGRYPATGCWTATSLTNAPSHRIYHTAVWADSTGEMIIWGGYDGMPNFTNTGGRYCAGIGLRVISSDPACGSVVFTQLTDFVINLSDPVQPATVQASDFTVNGTPANSFTLSNGNTTITFHYTSSPVITQGAQTMHIPAGAFLRDPDGDPVIEFTCTFRYDATLLAVTDSVPPVGGTFSPPAPGTYQYDLNWNEAVNPSSVQTSDLTLSGNTGATVTNVEVINGNTTTRFTLNIRFGGSMTADIAAGRITDQFGNPNAAFSGSYTVEEGAPPTCVPPPPNMVSWWPGDGNADDIVGSNNGTLHNGATFAPGMVDQAFSFDGIDDYVQATDTGLPFGAAARTLDFWMLPMVNAREPVIYGNFIRNDAFYVIVIGTNACIGQWGGGDACGSTNVTDGNWHHVALTYDGGSSAVLYVDGALEASTSKTYTTTQTGRIYIGSTVEGGGEHFHGLVDEVEIFSRALSQTEIQAIVNAGSAGKCKGTSTPTPTPSPTAIATATATATVTPTTTPTATATATATPTATATATPTATPTGTPSSTPRPTPTPRSRPTPAPRP